MQSQKSIEPGSREHPNRSLGPSVLPVLFWTPAMQHGFVKSLSLIFLKPLILIPFNEHNYGSKNKFYMKKMHIDEVIPL
jgi:hypothetical protein